jgi:hypothetical protein
MKVLAIIACCLLTGCINFTDSHGTRHCLIIGIGVVSISQTNQPVKVVKESLLGAELQAVPFKCTAGLNTTVTITAQTNVNAIVEVKSLPFKPLKVEIQK